MINKLKNAYQIDIYYKDNNEECNYLQIEGTFNNITSNQTTNAQIITARLEDRKINEKPFDVKIIYHDGKYYLNESIFDDTNLVVKNEDNEIIVLEDTNQDTILEISIHLEENKSKKNEINLSRYIQESIVKTNKQHIKYSEFSICYAPEYLITVNIANELSKLQSENIIDGIYLEWNIKDLISDEGLDEIKDIRDGKCDICILFKDGNNSLIEVKNTITQVGAKLRSIYKDIERIEQFVLNKDTSFHDGYVSFIVKAKSENKLEEKTKGFIEDMKKHFPNLILTEDISTFKEYENDDEHEYFLSSIVIKITLNN